MSFERFWNLVSGLQLIIIFFFLIKIIPLTTSVKLVHCHLDYVFLMTTNWQLDIRTYKKKKVKITLFNKFSVFWGSYERSERIILFKTMLHFFVVDTKTVHVSKTRSIKNKYHNNICLYIIHIHINIWITSNVNE